MAFDEPKSQKTMNLKNFVVIFLRNICSGNLLTFNSGIARGMGRC